MSSGSTDQKQERGLRRSRQPSLPSDPQRSEARKGVEVMRACTHGLISTHLLRFSVASSRSAVLPSSETESGTLSCTHFYGSFKFKTDSRQIHALTSVIPPGAFLTRRIVMLYEVIQAICKQPWWQAAMVKCSFHSHTCDIPFTHIHAPFHALTLMRHSIHTHTCLISSD